MQIEAVQTLVRQQQRGRLQHPAEGVPRRLGAAVTVDQSHARPVEQVLLLQHERAATRRLGASPLRERLGHHGGDCGATEVEVVVGLHVSDGDRIDIEELADVVVADVLEVPRTTGIPRYQRLPPMVADHDATCLQALHGLIAGNDGEGKAFSGESHPARACVGQRTSVGADPEVVRHAGVDGERQCAAARRVREVSDRGQMLAHEVCEQLAEQRIRRRVERSPGHGGLLRDFAPAAHREQAGAALQTGEHVDDFRRDLLDEIGVLHRIVEAGEHEVLPDQDAELVAEVEELRALVDHAALHPYDVHAGGADLLQGGAERARDPARVRSGRSVPSTPRGRRSTTPLTVNAGASVGPNESERKPTLDRVNIVEWLGLATSSEAAYSGCPPCVAGHHCSASGTRS